VQSVTQALPQWRRHLDQVVRTRAVTIRDGFAALRRATRDGASHRAEPVIPADILGIHVLVPVPGAHPAGVAR
jgi:hypothetical protein